MIVKSSRLTSDGTQRGGPIGTTLLAGDIGGTKTLLGLYTRTEARPTPRAVRRLTTNDFSSLGDVVAAFLNETAAMAPEPIGAACFGVAGPVHDQVAELTNVPWRIEAASVGARLGVPTVRLVNDLVAMAYAVPLLRDAELHVLQRGTPVASGNAALIAPGTGLGQALLHQIDGRFVPSPSEGGHADFAARTDRETALVAVLRAELGRVENDHVISGPGLVRIHRFLHGHDGCAAVPDDAEDVARPELITTAALERRCGRCVETLDLFVGALGAEAGNLALRSMATAGVYLGGGIPPKILPALQTPSFLEAFRAKAPMEELVEAIPVSVILEPEAALLGAAVAASELH